MPELTVRGIASDSKFVHQFFMTHSVCVVATFIAGISSRFSLSSGSRGTSGSSRDTRQGDVFWALLGSRDILG